MNDKINEFIEDGKKATQGIWYVYNQGPHHNNPDLADLAICFNEDTEQICDTVYERGDADFIVQSFHAREDIERMWEENKRLREVLFKNTIRRYSDNYTPVEYSALLELIRTEAKQALKGE